MKQVARGFLGAFSALNITLVWMHTLSGYTLLPVGGPEVFDLPPAVILLCFGVISGLGFLYLVGERDV